MSAEITENVSAVSRIIIPLAPMRETILLWTTTKDKKKQKIINMPICMSIPVCVCQDMTGIDSHPYRKATRVSSSVANAIAYCCSCKY